jgi:hypothetical protein
MINKLIEDNNKAWREAMKKDGYNSLIAAVFIRRFHELMNIQREILPWISLTSLALLTSSLF